MMFSMMMVAMFLLRTWNEPDKKRFQLITMMILPI